MLERCANSCARVAAAFASEKDAGLHGNEGPAAPETPAILVSEPLATAATEPPKIAEAVVMAVPQPMAAVDVPEPAAKVLPEAKLALAAVGLGEEAAPTEEERVVKMEAQLKRCERDAMHAITEARNARFDEIDKAHQKETATLLARAERHQRGEIEELRLDLAQAHKKLAAERTEAQQQRERAAKETKELEVSLQAQIRQLEDRNADSLARAERAFSGEERRAYERRVLFQGEQVDRAEEMMRQQEIAFEEAMRAAQERISRLEEQAAAASARAFVAANEAAAAGARATAARRRELRLRRRRRRQQCRRSHRSGHKNLTLGEGGDAILASCLWEQTAKQPLPSPSLVVGAPVPAPPTSSVPGRSLGGVLKDIGAAVFLHWW